MAKKTTWPRRNPETSRWPGMTTPLSTDAAPGDSNPGISSTVPDNPSAPNPVGWPHIGGGKGRGKK
jgi:hypothetical protein